jgi:hypothetical protein
VSVPETPVHEYNGLESGKNNIGLTWQSPVVKAESQAGFVQ